MFNGVIIQFKFDDRGMVIAVAITAAFVFIDGVVTGVGMVLLWQMVH